MTKHNGVIRREIESWREQGLVSGDLAEQLLQRYPVKSASIDWSRIIPTAAGAVIFGLGIVLFFAYNWEGMHRFVKLAFVGVALMAAHGTALWFSRHGDRHAALSDSLHLLGTMLFGVGIWLIAQIYHMDEHYPNAYLVWSIAALSMAWAIPSLAQALLSMVLVFMWGWFEIFDFYQAQHPANWLVAVGVVPLAFKLRSNVLLFFSLVVFIALHGFGLLQIDDDLLFPVILLLASALLAGAKLWPVAAEQGFAGHSFVPAMVMRRIGLALWVVFVYIGTFADIRLTGLDELPGDMFAWLYWGWPVALALVGWIVVIYQQRFGAGWPAQLETVAYLLVLMAVLASFFSGQDLQGITWLMLNLAYLLAGCVMLSRGLTEVRWGLTVLGTTMLTLIVFARFMDLFDSLLFRSALFVAVGISLFIVGQMFNRRKKVLQQSNKMPGVQDQDQDPEKEMEKPQGQEQGHA